MWGGGILWGWGEKSQGTNGLGEAFEEIDIGEDGLIGVVVELSDGVERADHGGPAWERESVLVGGDDGTDGEESICGEESRGGGESEGVFLEEMEAEKSEGDVEGESAEEVLGAWGDAEGGEEEKLEEEGEEEDGGEDLWGGDGGVGAERAEGGGETEEREEDTEPDERVDEEGGVDERQGEPSGAGRWGDGASVIEAGEEVAAEKWGEKREGERGFDGVLEMGNGLGEMVVDDIEHRAEVAIVEDEEDGGDDGEGEAIGGDLGSMAPEEISGDGESEGERLGVIEGEENGGDEGNAQGEGA